MHGSHCHWLNHVPDLAGLAESAPEFFPYLLDSAAQGKLGGHSMLLFADGEQLIKHADGRLQGPGQGDSFFQRLDSWFAAERLAQRDETAPDGPGVPFHGGWFLYLGYEMAGEVEPRLNLPRNHSALPDALAQRCTGAITVLHDQVAGERAVITAESAASLQRIKRLLESTAYRHSADVPVLNSLVVDDPEQFESGVRQVLHYLRAGDAFQVNISRRWEGRFARPPEPLALYRKLRHSNPAPFAGMMRYGEAALLSSSPERLVQIQGRQVQTRPIAGTRPRGTTVDDDQALSQELIGNIKERAEHVMLIDLERNDLGRVCRPGSVEVSELMVVESYSHVHHIVSNVRGELSPHATPVEAIKAVFPGGTITGCPKVRCMEIIAELEQQARGFYTGSMGYLGRNGDADMNILIRSMLLEGDQVSFRTGAGIVADSVPERELAETADKARGLLLALQQEHREALLA